MVVKGTRCPAALFSLLLLIASQDIAMAAKGTCGRVVDHLEAFSSDGNVAAATFDGFPDLHLTTDAPPEICKTQGCHAAVRIETPFQTLSEGPFLIDEATSFKIAQWGDVPPVDLMNSPAEPTLILSIYGVDRKVESTVTPSMRMLGVSRKDALSLNFDESRVQKVRTHYYNLGIIKRREWDKSPC